MSQIQLKKRFITSILLISLLACMLYYSYVLLISLLLISTIAWVEFYNLITKIFIKKDIKNKVFNFLLKSIGIIYLFFFSTLILIIKTKNPGNEIFIIYSLFVSIGTDIGGLLFGKIFKGKKLSKISPNKTISGAIGSFILSLFLIPILIKYSNKIFSVDELFIITLLISLTSQLGDLLISFLKRKAKVKNTSDLLPGHGGILDRIDGMLFAIPIGYLLLSTF